MKERPIRAIYRKQLTDFGRDFLQFTYAPYERVGKRYFHKKFDKTDVLNCHELNSRSYSPVSDAISELTSVLHYNADWKASEKSAMIQSCQSVPPRLLDGLQCVTTVSLDNLNTTRSSSWAANERNDTDFLTSPVTNEIKDESCRQIAGSLHVRAVKVDAISLKLEIERPATNSPHLALSHSTPNSPLSLLTISHLTDDNSNWKTVNDTIVGDEKNLASEIDPGKLAASDNVAVLIVHSPSFRPDRQSKSDEADEMKPTSHDSLSSKIFPSINPQKASSWLEAESVTNTSPDWGEKKIGHSPNIELQSLHQIDEPPLKQNISTTGSNLQISYSERRKDKRFGSSSSMMQSSVNKMPSSLRLHRRCESHSDTCTADEQLNVVSMRRVHLWRLQSPRHGLINRTGTGLVFDDNEGIGSLPCLWLNSRSRRSRTNRRASLMNHSHKPASRHHQIVQTSIEPNFKYRRKETRPGFVRCY